MITRPLKLHKALFSLILSFAITAPHGYAAQTIAEKKASLGTSTVGGDLSKEMQRFLTQVNAELKDQQSLLRTLYEQVRELYNEEAPPEEYQTLLLEINKVRTNIEVLESSWREMSADNNQEEEYALWHQPETTLGDLVIDFGSQDYVYLMSPEIEDTSLSVNSNIPIPRAGWNEMLELIFTQNGIGIKQLNPYLRQLFILKEDNSNIRLITDNRDDLNAFPDEARVCFVLSPNPSELRRTWFFLEKFANPNSSEVQMTGRDILIIAPVSEVRELLKLYDFVESNSGNIEYRIIPLKRVDAKEMGNILSTIFEQFEDDSEVAGSMDGESFGKAAKVKYQGTSGLRIITLATVAQALFLIGTPEEIRKAEDIIDQVEAEVGGARDKIVYTYECKHTDCVELADILDRVYTMMVQTGAGIEGQNNGEVAATDIKAMSGSDSKSESHAEAIIEENSNLLSANQIFNPGYFQDGSYVINSDLIRPGSSNQGNPEPNKGRSNFIVDVKTGKIVMVVESIFLPKLKELIRKLDIPKKMVQIEVLLFEKECDKENIFALNLLRLGDKASNKDTAGLSFNDLNPVSGGVNLLNRGILEFCLSRACTSTTGAYDLAYRFLLSRDDVTINSNPSVVAVNQTTAVIEIKDQISINTGTLLIDSTGGAIPNNQFIREEYGITIKVTPTIHMRDENEEWNSLDDDTNFITLQSDITFDTFDRTVAGTITDRPDVKRRHVVNEVRIADGQTVIIGGLRSKETSDSKKQIPLLGELPGIGKLFSDTSMKDTGKEMFIFITPKIISDPLEEMERIRTQQLCRRPGDIPAFLCRLDRAREQEKRRLFEGYMTMILGKEPAPIYFTPREFDGRCR